MVHTAAAPSCFSLMLLILYSLVSRLNTKLEANGYPPMVSLVQDLSDGVRLIQLMVSTGPTILALLADSIFDHRRR